MGLDFGAFTSGIVNAGSADLEARRASALELKMKNKLMEQELMHKQQMWDYQKASPETTSQMGQFAAGEGKPNIYRPGQRASVPELGLLNDFQTNRTMQQRAFAGDQRVHDITVRDLIDSGIPERLARTATRADMAERSTEPDKQMFDETKRFMTGAKRLPEYKEAVKRMFKEGDFNKLKTKFSTMTDSDFARIMEPRINVLQKQLVSILGPADAGKAQTLIELSNLKTQLGSWYEGEESFNKTMDALVDRIVNDHVRNNLDSGRMGRSRKMLVDQFNKDIAAPLKLKKMSQYLPQMRDEHEEQDERDKAAKAWAAKIGKIARGEKAD